MTDTPDRDDIDARRDDFDLDDRAAVVRAPDETHWDAPTPGADDPDIDPETGEPIHAKPGHRYPFIADARPEPQPPLSAQEIYPTTLPFGFRSDAFCTVAWIVPPFEAVSVFADPALMDRARDLCEGMNALVATHRSLDALSEAINRWAEGAGLSASIYDVSAEDLSRGLLAVSLEIG